MKANGRRAWRKAAKKYRRGHHLEFTRASAAWRATDGQRVVCSWSGAVKRRHAGLRNGRYIEPLPPLPTRPFTPRSLVGMSNGSRRRLCFALGYLIAVMCGGPARYTMQGVQSFGVWLWFKKMPGQRLRRCPDCEQCLVCVQCENEKCDKEHHRQTICDGSGVLS